MEDACQAHNKRLFVPPDELCSDNGAMIAWAGWELLVRNSRVDIAHKDTRCVPRMPLGPLVRYPLNRRGFLRSKQ